MSEQIQTPEPMTIEQADQYLESVREHFVHGDSDYRGTRSDEQKMIAEFTSEEASLLMDETMGAVLKTGFIALSPPLGEARTAKLPLDYEDVETAGFTWKQFRGEFSRLLVAVAVITNRLENNDYNVRGFADMSGEDRRTVAMALMRDFLTHNSLRFGTEGSGVHGISRVHDEEFNVKEVRIEDKDIAKRDKDIKTNMRQRGIVSNNATHAAGKMSPAKYKELRKSYPELDKDTFDYIIGFHQNAERDLEELGQ